jgi:hypothetical protein
MQAHISSRLIGAALALALASSAAAQVAYTQDFNANIGGWTVTGGFQPGWISGGACSGGCLKSNLYQAGTSANFVSPSLGSSLGGSTTVAFDYRIFDYTTGYVPSAPASLPPFGTVNVQWANSATGPWTTIGTFSDEAQTSACINKSFTFTPTAGPLFVRLNCVYLSANSADDWWNFDNVSVTEASGGCSGTPTPGNTVGPVGGACPGSNFTLSLQNTTTGTGVGYQWYYGPSSSGPWLTLGTAATQVVSQTLDTWYYCDVTCGSATGSSTPVQVAMSVPSFPQDFSGGVVDPNCWSVASVVGTNLPNYAAASAFAAGTGSARYNFYNFSNTSAQMALTSPTFAPTAAGDQVFFDVAGATYTGGEIDEVLLQESNDGGATWTTLVTMTNNPAGGVLNTGGVNASPFVPSASQWASLAYTLTPGTNRIRLLGDSDYGNDVYFDNISVGVLPSARHTAYGRGCGTAPVMALSAAPAPVSTGTTGTTVVYTIDNIPLACPSPAPAFNFGIVMISLGQDFAGTELPSLGVASPGCNLHITSLDVTLGYVGSTASQTVNFDVPAAVSGGFLFYAQAAALICPASPNDAGVLLSNGVRSYVNNF